MTANIAHLAEVHGIEKLVFVTLGFAELKPGETGPDPSRCPKEAQRRLNSLLTHVLRELFIESICVPERGGKGGRLHFHFVAAQESDVRTGVDFEAFARGDFRSAPKALRRFWAICREKLEPHGFGGWHEVMPVKSTAEGISKYVGKYISKQFAGRRPEDKGMRLVRYTRGTNPHRVTFSWNTQGGRLWRWQVGAFARMHGCADMDALTEKYPKWSYWQWQAIRDIEPPSTPVWTIKDEDGDVSHVSLWDVWQAGRIQRCALVAEAIDCTTGEIYTGLYQQKVFKTAAIEYTLPRWSGENLVKKAKEEQWERTIIWADGSAERVFET